MNASHVAAGMLRTVLAELPPRTPGETATARRIEGAALALDTLSTPTRSGTPDPWTAPLTGIEIRHPRC